jgi:hypothetical protein
LALITGRGRGGSSKNLVTGGGGVGIDLCTANAMHAHLLLSRIRIIAAVTRSTTWSLEQSVALLHVSHLQLAVAAATRLAAQAAARVVKMSQNKY